MKNSNKKLTQNEIKQDQIKILNEHLGRILKITQGLEEIDESNKIELFNLNNEIEQVNEKLTKEFKDYLDTQEKDNTECKECDKKNTYDL